MPRYVVDWSKEKAFRRDDEGCLLWRGSQHSKGHPTLYMITGPTKRERRAILVRRAIMALSLGRPLKATERVIAKCGKQLCCSCLRTASSREIGRIALARHDWTKDIVRRLKISGARRRVWTDDQVADIRARHASGERPCDIAAQYATRSANLYHILNYRSHVLRLPQAVRTALAHTGVN